MTLTLTEARDAVYSFVKTAWGASAVTSSYPMLYDNVVGDKPGEDEDTTRAAAWARTTVRTFESPQSTVGVPGRYQTQGGLVVQVFTPFGDGHALGDAICEVLLSALRGQVGTPDTLWFFDVFPAEIGQDGPWFQTNINATFRYQEVA